MLRTSATRIVTLVASLTLALVGIAASAPAADAYTPKNNQLTFNNPRKASQRYKIIYELDRAITAAPAGSTITMAMYLFDRPTTAKALVAAHKRKVNVQILLDNGTDTKETRMLYRELGRNKKASSFVATCGNSCMQSIPSSVMHAKLYLFSQSGAAKWVSIVSSGNPHYVNSANSFNNQHTVTNNTTIYNGLRRYFLDMITGKDRPNYYRTVQSGTWKLYFFPKALVRGKNISPSLDVLNHVSCKTGGGYGSKGKTVIRVGMWGWTAGRNDIARRLWALHNAGCKVDALINRGRMSKSTLAILLKRSSKHGQMKVYDIWRDKNRNNKAETYIHHKAFIINGRWFGQNTKVVYTGSQNWTPNGTLANNDILLRIKQNSVYNAYSANFSMIRSKYGKRMYSVPYKMNLAVTFDSDRRLPTADDNVDFPEDDN